uniref:LRRCT domain-containing protein n=1 Tax=Denticeps clupeoides TaxID=299321 RepID=A0AAY4AML3_9TELE
MSDEGGRRPASAAIMIYVDNWRWVTLFLLCLARSAPAKRIFRCPAECTCSKDSVICVGSSFIPRTVSNDINSLSIVNGTFPEIKEATFSLMPSLQLLSLANNNIKLLPKDLFSGLDSLIELDLRGNMFECDCQTKWLIDWLKRSNATVSDVYCNGPGEKKGLRTLIPLSSLDFVLHQTLSTQSMSAELFFYKEDIYMALAVPNSENCLVMEWDHIEINFRPLDTITGLFLNLLHNIKY